MKKNYFKSIFLFASIIMLSLNACAQKQPAIWSETSSKRIDANEVKFYKQIPQKSTLFNVNVEQLSNSLVNAPKRSTNAKVSNLITQFPNADGKLESFRISEVSVMEPSLAAQFPEIKSYVGIGIENPAAMVRLTISPQKGLSGMILSEKKTVFIEPYSNDLKTYISFINSEGDINTENFVCETESFLEKSSVSDEEYRVLRNADDGQLRTYRLALACTGEYAQFHGGTIASVMAAMNVTINRNNGVYERDLGLTMMMVDNTSIIFLNGATDPYTNNDGGAMLGQNQTTVDTNIGSANYDVGHVFSTGGGGIAALNSPCTGFKAQGVTGLGAPVGDAFDIDFVAHELGHQFGGNHTQNNNCQRSAVSVEPGSASSIMGYAGICPPNVQNNSDDYFHGENIKEMWLNISVGNSSTCGTLTATGNTAPTSDAGADYSIPPSTAFKLTGIATDANAGNALTYSWEQNDTTPATMPPVSTNTAGPTFRSLDPKTVPERYFPDFATVLGGSLASTWEVVPSVARTMSFLFTVRDNAPIAGNTQSDEMTVTVVNAAPFTVVTPASWVPGSTQTVVWTVGQTNNVATIDCQTVNILFSSDGGNNFDTTLATGVPNTGTASITVPSIPLNATSRILVEAADNVFYAITDIFPLTNTGTSDFSISSITGAQSACNIDAVSYDFNYITSNGFSETTTLSAAGQPAGSTVVFTPSTINTDGIFTMDVSGLTGATPGDYTITVTGTAPSVVKTATVMLTVANGVCPSEGDLTYQTRTTGVIFNTISNLDAGPKTVPYEFFALSTDVEQGSSHDITVNANSDGNYQIITRVWIDWNQNCSFNDAGEEYDLGTSVNIVDLPTVNSPLTIVVPTDAALGTTRMRVSTKYTDPGANQFPTSCEVGFDGEVEDYSVNVVPPLSVDEFALNSLAIYPNPNNGEFNVKFNTTSNNIEVSVFDIRGRSILRSNYSNASGEFNETVKLGNVESGMYLLNINNGSKTITKKIIVE